MLHVDVPTNADIQALAVERTPMAVSIYLPTTPVAGEISGDRTALKNLTREAVHQLTTAGHAKAAIEMLELHLTELAEDDSFWRFQAHSLAVFATPAGTRTYRVPNALMPMVEVADRFFIKPLLRAVTFPNAAHVLALAEGSVRLLEISPDLPVTEAHVPGLPKDAGAALGTSSMGVSTQSRRADSASGQRAKLAAFCRIVDRAVRGHIAGHHTPLFLAADPALGAIYRSVNSVPGLVPFGIDHSPADMRDTEIGAHARGLLDRLYAEDVAAVRAQFDDRAGNGRATADIAMTARAATMGAIATLMVDIDGQTPGTIDEDSGAVHFAAAETASNYGVTDEIARRALLSGARVLAVRKADLPGDTPVAAILRWAV
jgi:hypothetical protein